MFRGQLSVYSAQFEEGEEFCYRDREGAEKEQSGRIHARYGSKRLCRASGARVSLGTSSQGLRPGLSSAAPRALGRTLSVKRRFQFSVYSSQFEEPEEFCHRGQRMRRQRSLHNSGLLFRARFSAACCAPTGKDYRPTGSRRYEGRPYKMLDGDYLAGMVSFSYLARSTFCHSPCRMPSRICAGVLPRRVCSYV
jgi:hypothetical protein